MQRRPREKTHRPQTRRRRDQADDSLDKLRQLRSNLGRARELLDTLARREQRKAHVLVRRQPALVAPRAGQDQ